MDDLLSLVVLIVFYVIVAKNRKNRKNKVKSEPKIGRTQKRASKETWEEIRQNLSRAMDTLETAKEAPKDVQMAMPLEQEQPCQTQSIHLHEGMQQQMNTAGEGEDPCHVGDAKLREDSELATGYMDEEPDQTELAQDVLRGVIMSEILMRPCERAYRARMKRGA